MTQKIRRGEMKLISEKRLQKDWTDKWQVLSPVSNKWVTLDNQDDECNRARNREILEKARKVIV